VRSIEALTDVKAITPTIAPAPNPAMIIFHSLRIGASLVLHL
jgi:hypothetical protein